MSTTQFLQIDQNTLKTVIEKYGRTEKSFRDDVIIIREWMKTQNHLPEILDDKYLENFLILNKCSIEKTKQKIDMYYTLRNVIPDMWENNHPKCPNMQLLTQIAGWVLLPHLTQQLYRVWMFKVLNKDLVNKLLPKDIMALITNIQEIRFNEDVMYGDVIFVDWEGINLEFILKITPAIVAKMFGIYEKIYSIPMKAFYIFNAHPMNNRILALMKNFLKPKLYERISVHEGASIVLKIIPKEHTPRDYGGEERSFEELFDDMKCKLSEYQTRFDKLENLRVDESLRPERLMNDEILGFHGNFKQLDID